MTARRWFTVYSTFTDFNGNYRMGRGFNRPCNYSLWFEHNRFAVTSGSTHWIDGPKEDEDWNHTIANGFDRFVGHIFRGAYRYHYKDIDGLQRPFRWLGRRTGYIAMNTAGVQGSNPIYINTMKIWRFRANNSDSEYGSDDVFSTTCHETAHTSHSIRMNTIIQFWQVARKLQESWAIVIEWVLSNREYSDRGIANYGQWNYHPTSAILPFPSFPNDQAYQYWNIGRNDGWYTPIYIDVIDNHNQLNIIYPDRVRGTTNDQIQGYSLAFIESNLLKHIYGLSSLSSQLKNNKPGGVTDGQIDLLISFY